MATRAITTGKSGPGTYKATWTGLLNTDDGAPWSEDGGSSSFADKVAHVTGTFGVGGTVVIEGSNDGVNWAVLNDPTGVAIALNATSPLSGILENPLNIRPRVSAGDGTTNLTVVINGRTIIV